MLSDYSKETVAEVADVHQYQQQSDAEAVEILVELIKSPDIGIEQLAAKVSKPGKPVAVSMIKGFLQFHGLLKKTSATGR
jgi:hypothetical protein